MDFFLKKKITLVITAFAKRLSEVSVGGRAQPEHGYVPNQVLQLNVDIGNPNVREEQATDAYRLLYRCLQTGENAYVHCMGGVHRAPGLLAIFLAAMRGVDVTNSMHIIGKLRAVEFHKFLQPRRGKKQMEDMSVFMQRLAESLKRLNL
jgi:protein-tyrosine phosphatase